MVWQGLRLRCVAETGRFVAMETPYLRFSCLLAFVPCFLFLVFRFSFHSFPVLFFSASLNVHLLRVPTSVQQPFSTLGMYVFYSKRSLCLCHLYPTPCRNSFVFFLVSYFFRCFFFLGWRFFVVLSYPVRQHLICLPWFLSVCFSSVSVCDHRICISLGWRINKDTGGSADVVG